jgi:hypothetical protein
MRCGEVCEVILMRDFFGDWMTDVGVGPRN